MTMGHNFVASIDPYCLMFTACFQGVWEGGVIIK